MTFAGDVSLDGARFDRLASFFGARFEGNVSLAGVRFTRELSFHGVTVRGHVSLDRAVMSRDALFSQAVFGHGLSCERARFRRVRHLRRRPARRRGRVQGGALRPYAVVPQGQRARRVRGGALRRGRVPVGDRPALGGQGARRRAARRGGRAVRCGPAARGGDGPDDRAADGLAGRPGGRGAARPRHRHGARQVHADLAAAGRRDQPGAVRAGPVGVPVRGAGAPFRGAGEGVHVRAHAPRGAGEPAVADVAVVLAAAGAGRRAYDAQPFRHRPPRRPWRLTRPAGGALRRAAARRPRHLGRLRLRRHGDAPAGRSRLVAVGVVAAVRVRHAHGPRGGLARAGDGPDGGGRRVELGLPRRPPPGNRRPGGAPLSTGGSELAGDLLDGAEHARPAAAHDPP
ncbi:pentapeptide repeat-containing protein [Nonomuraea rubra]|uniref:pentapeptide repeat-containing protein n=1 Tax=Nonomuraea rubra TaxID=46180 RepID=UPI003CD07B3F